MRGSWLWRPKSWRRPLPPGAEPGTLEGGAVLLRVSERDALRLSAALDLSGGVRLLPRPAVRLNGVDAVTRRMAVVERDPWDALIASDEIPMDLLDRGLGPDRGDRPSPSWWERPEVSARRLVACGLALAAAAAGRPSRLPNSTWSAVTSPGAWGVPPQRTIDDLTTVIDELMPSHVEMVCHPHASGVWLLLAPRRPEREHMVGRARDAPAASQHAHARRRRGGRGRVPGTPCPGGLPASKTGSCSSRRRRSRVPAGRAR